MSRPLLLLFTISLFLAPAALRAQQPDSGAAAFYHRPDIHGDQVVFTSEGDLWLASTRGGPARRLTTDDGIETAAHFSPDGAQIAFSGQYDGGTEVYVMPAEGGMARRVTFGGAAVVQGWTPDGKNILFRSRRQSGENQDRLWSVPVGGGVPSLLPIPEVEFASMNADGHRVAFVPVSGEWQHWKAYRGGQADDVWLADLQEKTFKRLTDFPGVDTAPVWVGNTIYFVSERDGLGNLYRMETSGAKVTPVTTYADYDVRYPASDGHRVVFEHGDRIEVYDPKTGDIRPVEVTLNSERIRARTRYIPLATAWTWASPGPTGKRVVLEARGQILTVPAENGDMRVIAPMPGSRSQFPVWSPDGRSIAFVSDRSGEDQIWIVPAGGGAPRELHLDHKGPLAPMLWSTDSKKLVVGDHEMRIMVVDAQTGAMKVVDQADRGGTYHAMADSFRFSPDGKWLTYNQTLPNYNDVVYLYDLETGKRTAVSSPEMNSYHPAFDPSGKYLVFLSDRSFNPQGSGPSRFFEAEKTTRVSLVPLAADTPSPFLIGDDEENEEAPKPAPAPTVPAAEKPATPATAPAAGAEKPAVLAPPGPPAGMKVDLDGIQERIIDVPVPADRYASVDALDGRLLLLAADPDGGGAQLRSFDLKSKGLSVLASRISGFEISANRRKLLVLTGKEIQLVDAGGPVAPGAGRVDLGGDMLTVDPAAEWKQIYQEAWRVERDFFYDPGLHGTDWDAVHRKYERLLPAVADRSDLNFILGEMIAELNAGHAYVAGGDLVTAPPITMGYLGIDVEPAPEGGGYRIVKLLRGDGFDYAARSPLLEPGLGVKPGDYIVAVGGEPVKTDHDLQAYLLGRAGHITSLRINSKPSMEGSREIRVRPMANEVKARYYDWVAGRLEYVHAHGGPNLGYIHLPDMVNGGLEEFLKHYYANLTKDGIIYDVRDNGGGYISAMLLLQMSSKPYAYFKPRYGASWTRQDWGFPGYSVALCNEHSGSNAEEFCDAFQRLKLGPVIGSRTWGGEVGSGGGYALIDGGKIYPSNYGEWSPDGKWVIEGSGVHPDQDVENDPTSLMAGKDPQLDRAIEELKQRLTREPIQRPIPPPFPVKNGRTRTAAAAKDGVAARPQEKP